jgi:iron complex outermembrane receptor protein
MIKNYLILLMLFVGTINLITAQEVSGIVLDDTSQPLPGASVVVKGTTTGTTTDFDGNYTISANMGDTLVYSFVGFDTQEIIVNSIQINVTMQSGVSLDEIVILGSRNKSRVATDTPVAVDVLDVEELMLSTPQVDVNQILNYAAPSFTANTQTISDGTDHIDPASLRALGPDQVLVLINGKRRHKTSLVNVNGTFGRGSVGTDMNAIPAHAIDRIEILRDGAAAQYGSDAIAGVINVVLKRSTDLTVSMHTGANFTKNEDEMTGNSDTVTDGEKVGVSINYGLPIGDDGGFINFTGSFDYRGRTNRMLEWEGSIFNAYNSIERVARNDGYDTSLLLDSDLDDIFQYAGQAGISLTGSETLSELQTILGEDATSSELSARGMQRSDFNMNVGQSELRNSQFFANLSIPLGENTEIYAFGGLGYRDGNATGFYRLPNQNRTYTPAYPNGFLPQIHSNIVDKSISVGITGALGDWDVDFSNTYGRNSFEFNIRNSSNASMQNSTPFEAFAGGFAYAENTVNFDVSQFFDNIMSGLNIAFGAEYRMENVHDPTDDTSMVPTDFLGRSRPGGIQVFPGFRPENELNEFRNSIAGYFDVEADVSETFLLAGAVRYENYSDFGGTFNGKLATRIKAGDNINFRAAVQTGFRAPSLHQIHFNSTSTLFVDGIPFEVGVFPNTSRIARILGIEQLQDETSFGVSLGFTANIPDANLKVTIDGYLTTIDDRVIETGQFTDNDNAELAVLFAQANAERVGFFANAVDTKTTGLDIVIDHKASLSDKLNLKNTLAFTFSDTEIEGVNIPDAISAAGLGETFFDQTSRIYIESAVPRVKGNLLHNLRIGEKWNIFLRNAYFGEVTEATNNASPATYGGKIVTDLSFGYQMGENTRVTFGANNLLDVYSDQVPEDFRSSGRFIYSRRSQQFGTNGRHLFARLNFTIN